MPKLADSLFNELLARHDIDKRYVQTELLGDFLGDFLGLTFKQIMSKLAAKHGFVLKDKVFDLIRAREEEEIIKIVQEKGKACKGCVQVLEKLADSKKYPVAIVSSSSSECITSTRAAMDQLRFFKTEDIYSAVDSLPGPKRAASLGAGVRHSIISDAIAAQKCRSSWCSSCGLGGRKIDSR
jgi:beta-phosphoglucomutase-like phosphatase (HAD superfamily)